MIELKENLGFKKIFEIKNKSFFPARSEYK